ncbi:MAG: hemerythrin domain-containing protein [Planctomycetes bacterium]|nr:hemerythrin domain-containing protein [Planctomycetota bacterium]
MTNPSEPQHPTTVLRSEHQTILRVIAVLERLVVRSEQGDGFEHAALRRCVEFFQLFADACHHAKEEELLFPVLEARGIPREGGPIGVMLYEHTLARRHTKEMADALGALDAGDKNAERRFNVAAHEYIELLTNHIHKEDNVLFDMGDRVMSDDDQTTLCKRFCEVGCRAFDGKKREELVQVADELEQ